MKKIILLLLLAATMIVTTANAGVKYCGVLTPRTAAAGFIPAGYKKVVLSQDLWVKLDPASTYNKRFLGGCFLKAGNKNHAVVVEKATGKLSHAFACGNRIDGNGRLEAQASNPYGDFDNVQYAPESSFETLQSEKVQLTLIKGTFDVIGKVAFAGILGQAQKSAARTAAKARVKSAAIEAKGRVDAAKAKKPDEVHVTVKQNVSVKTVQHNNNNNNDETSDDVEDQEDGPSHEENPDEDTSDDVEDYDEPSIEEDTSDDVENDDGPSYEEETSDDIEDY